MNWHEYFTYDAETGDLTWKERPREHFKNDHDWRVWNTRDRHKKARSKNACGYLRVGLHGKRPVVHRIVWEMHHGPIPEGVQIDHIDGVRDNNKIDNLRVCTLFQNAQNRKIHKNNTSGFKGVRFHKLVKKWEAIITANKKTYRLGWFDTPEEASDCYLLASRRLHKSFTRT